MDHISININTNISGSGYKEGPPVSPSLASIMMAMEMKNNHHNDRVPSSSMSRNRSASSRNPSNSRSSNINNNTKATGGSYKNSHHNLHDNLDDPPTLYRRNSDGSHASSTKSRGNKQQVSNINISPKKNKNNAKTPTEPQTNGATTKTDSNNTATLTARKKVSKKPKNPLRVLGIALIVDQKGTGARMLARYPTSQASVKKDEDEDGGGMADANTNTNNNNRIVDRYHDEDVQDHDDDDELEGNGDDRRRHGSGDDDLFFTLTARQMAKLFRTKRSLCNQPMTLRVNKTIFCCYAVLLEDTSNNPSADNSSEKDKNQTFKTVSSAASFTKVWDGGDPIDDDYKENNSLRLFSVVVALSPSTQQSAQPFSNHSDFDGFLGGGEDRWDLERYIRRGGIPSSQAIPPGIGGNGNNKNSKNIGSSTSSSSTSSSNVGSSKPAIQKNPNNSRLKQKKKQKAARISSVFLAIRRVHISLIRFCRALEREEHRCDYVTYQSRALFQTRNERQKQWDLMRTRKAASPMTTTANTTSNTVGAIGGGDRSPYPERGGGGGVGLIGGGVHHHHTPRHSRQNSFISSQNSFLTPGGGSTLLSDTTLKTAFEKNDLGGEAMGSVEQEQEKEQEILELMLACNPQDKPQGLQQQQQQQQQEHPYQNRQHGNLVRDLVAVFHSLSRNDDEYPPTPSSLLCERDAVVYVNQHFAIPIDAAGLSRHSQSSSFAQITEGGRLPVVRPYYTLLFPHASPSELLQTFHASGSAPPQQMEHLLLTVNPQKPLTQIATDANLPMHSTMQIASFLIAHGACTTSPVVSSRSRLTCFGSDIMQRIPELALDFSQAFPGVSLVGVVSFLTTSSRYLGDAMAILADIENDKGAWLRESLLASHKYRHQNYGRGVGDGDNAGGATESANADSGNTKSTLQGLFSDEKNESMSYSPTIQPYAPTSRGGGTNPSLGMAPEPTPMSVHEWELKDLEELLFSIAVWLLSHRVLVQLQEYMVVVAEVSSPYMIGVSGNGDYGSMSSEVMSPPLTAEDARGTTKEHSSAAAASNTTGKCNNHANANDWDENMLKELLEMEYLNGDISIMALSWRMAMDPRKLRRWGLRHKRVRVISRVPSSGDDWEPATTPPTPPLPPLEQPLTSPLPSPSPATTATTTAAAAST